MVLYSCTNLQEAMMTRKNALDILAIAIVSILYISPVHAGNIVLISDNWDYIYKLQYKTGMNAPEKGKMRTIRDVPEGARISGMDRICYRRKIREGDAMSGWRCRTNTLDRPETGSID